MYNNDTLCSSIYNILYDILLLSGNLAMNALKRNNKARLINLFHRPYFVINCNQ